MTFPIPQTGMTIEDQLGMVKRLQTVIAELENQIKLLEPKAQAYDVLCQVVSMSNPPLHRASNTGAGAVFHMLKDREAQLKKIIEGPGADVASTVEEQPEQVAAE